MSDQDTDSQSTDSPTEVSTDRSTEASSDRTTRASPGDDRDVRGLLLRGTLLVLGVLAVVALFQFYTSALAVIDQWIAREYRALLRAAFNLAVLFATALGISLVVRELGDY